MRPGWKQMSQRAARLIRDEQGVELTPDEVDQHRQAAFAKIRAEMRKTGLILPDDDHEMLEVMCRIRAGEPLERTATPDGMSVMLRVPK